MIKKQTNRFNFILLFFLLSFCVSRDGFSQEVEQQLATADSLFELKKYTESFQIYDDIYIKQQQVSPRMFLRMAFIKEGLGNYSEALYYLNEYYLATSDKKAQDKMKEIAEANDLSGFDVNDRAFFMRQLRANFDTIVIGLFSIVPFIFLLILYKKIKLNQRPVSTGFMLILCLTALFYLVNFAGENNEGIIIENHAYIMSGPSGGSDLIEVVKNGHKVKIIEEEDLWVAIEWNGGKGYIRKSKLKKFG